MKKEVWKAIPGYDGLYECSTMGHIRSTDYKRSGKTVKLKPALDKKGYFRTALTRNGVAKTVKVHRMVAITFIPNTENKSKVNHINGVKSDNRIENLEWSTNRENVIHSYDLGLQVCPSGDNHHRTKYSDEFVKGLLEELNEGATKRGLARKYNVDRSIFRRKIANE